ncbi:MAG: hypothetical protein HY827_05065 [Actinobacteria bacterium]|nr:hypothetical protein [Actinomycetota bacterium]
MAIAVAVLLIATTADAKDSHAPPGARDRWLPCESWVMFHWMPFSERKLYRLTGISREEFRRYIKDDDHHTLGKLVQRHGKDPDAVVAGLVSDWNGRIDDVRLAELTRRANELMTQGHLAQHVFFHYFHDPAIALNSAWIFGVRSADFQRARLQGWSPAEIADHTGRSRVLVVRRAMAVVKRYARRSVRLKQSSKSQAELFTRLQHRAVHGWLHQDIHDHRQRSFPRNNPSMKGSRLHRSCAYLAGRSHPAGEHDEH